MRTAQDWLDAYGESHQNPINKTIHWICIPWIMISLLGLLASIPSPFANPWLNWGTGLIAFAIVYYAMLSVPLAIGMAVVGSLMIGICMGIAQLPIPLWLTSLIIFVTAWIGQFIGHKIEGKKPSFFEDLQFLLIGPMWLLAAIYRRFGLSY
ncbi:DUF962 domain-containing protein [Nannocystaceae bacterium ST9]